MKVFFFEKLSDPAGAWPSRSEVRLGRCRRVIAAGAITTAVLKKENLHGSLVAIFYLPIFYHDVLLVFKDEVFKFFARLAIHGHHNFMIKVRRVV